MSDEVTERLDQLIRLVALGLCADKSQKDQIAFLSKAGIQPKAIAEILGTTPNTVSVSLSAIRKANKALKKSTKEEL